VRHTPGDEFRRYTHGDVFEGSASAAMLSELRMLLYARNQGVRAAIVRAAPER